MKIFLKKLILSNIITKKIWFNYQKLFFKNSIDYWENRYKLGRSSGNGSYGKLAEFKASVLNDFVNKNNIKNIIEFGCGDGNNLKYYNFNSYLGLDISRTIINLNIKNFKNDKSKSFFYYNPNSFVNNAFLSADLVISLDVIYHLVEDKIYFKYLNDLFKTSSKYVIIYSNNIDSERINAHVKTRKFTKDIESLYPNWKLISVIKNKISKKKSARVDFYIFKKTN